MKISMSLTAACVQGTLTASQVTKKAFRQGHISDGSRSSACDLHRIILIDVTKPKEDSKPERDRKPGREGSGPVGGRKQTGESLLMLPEMNPLIRKLMEEQDFPKSGSCRRHRAEATPR